MLKLGLLIFVLCYSFARAQPRTFTVDYANNQFLKDGQPFQYLSGSVHYFRIHPDYWEDRLKRARAAGLNAIQIYLPWNNHEPFEGEFDFSGWLNITRFITLAQENGLYVLFRPGPFICSEWEFGGLPWWLLKYEGIKLRSSDPRYQNTIKNYYTQLFAIIKPLLYKNGGPILMVQIENEFGNWCYYGHDQAYLTFLRDLTWELLGNDTVLYTNNKPDDRSLGCGTIENAVSSIDLGVNSHSNLSAFLELSRKYGNGGPYVMSEFWSGELLTWGLKSTTPVNTDVYMDNLAYMYSLNASINIYIFQGGTDWGFQNGAEYYAPVITSYDTKAPVSENGDTTDFYLKIRSFIQNLPNWATPPLEIPPNITASNYGQVTFSRLGSSLLSTLTQLQETCHYSVDPLTFEQIDHPYGFVLYTTTLKTSGLNLTALNIKDFGYVYLNNVYQGMLNHYNNKWISLSGAKNGDVLRILVENGGRRSYYALNEPVTDMKGLHENVTLDNVGLQNWYSCGINLTKSAIDSLATNFLEESKHVVETPEKDISSPGVYIGKFTASQLADTFFDSTGWSKGQLFVNGYNLGRYWSTAGPQITLYIPKPYLQESNTVVLLELNGAQQSYAQFIDHAVWEFP